MATRTPKVLYEGQLPNAKGTLYTVPALTKAYITSIVAFNKNTTTETTNMYYNPSGTSRQLFRAGLDQNEHWEYGGGDVLEAGALIEGDTTTAAKVDIVIMGIEET